MGRNAAFGRPGAPDRLQAWWQATSKTAKANLALFFVVGSVALGLVLAALSRDASRTSGLATASRPRVNVPVAVPTVPTTLDGAPPGLAAAPAALGDQGSTTTTTAATTSGGAARPATVGGSAPSAVSPSPAPTAPNPGIVFTEVPAAPPAPEPTSPPPTLAPTVTSTTPRVTTPPTSAPPTSAAPPSSTTAPTTSTLLPALPLFSGPPN